MTLPNDDGLILWQIISREHIAPHSSQSEWDKFVEGYETAFADDVADLAQMYWRERERVTEITESEWRSQFAPGDLLDFHDPAVKQAGEQYIWTRLDEVGESVIVPGRDRADCVGCYLAVHPWNDDALKVSIDD
jgi:hypothetical protein